MRVIAGKYKGRTLVPIDGERVRPTTDKVKESIFGSIQFDIAGSVFVDLFAGSGAMGIEALSRGAERVIFVDESRASIDIVRSNIVKVKVDDDDHYDIRCSDYREALRSLGTKVDIVFVDPPYKDKPINSILSIIADRDILNDDGMVIYEHLAEDECNISIDGYEVAKHKRYGTIAVEVIRRV